MKLLAGSISALVLVVVACGGPAASPTALPTQAPADTPAATQAPTATPAVTEPSAETPAATADEPSAQARVRIANFAFDPAALTVSAGTTVTWTNADSAPHTVTFSDGSADSGEMSGGASFRHTFSTEGELAYFCEIHPSMQGTVTVSP